MRPKKFRIPCDGEGVPNLDRKVVIVSVFGKSQFQAKGCKANIFSSILQVDSLEEPTIDKISSCEIEGYHDPKTRTVYLHLKGLLDTYTLIQEYDDFIEKQERKDFLSAWALMRNKYSRALLALFHLSHVIVLSHPNHSFDYSYVHLFRALDTVRQKTQSHLSEVLGTISGLSKEWISSCRPCSPRVLFYFETCPPVFCDPDRKASLKKLEHSLEDRIYQILRKNRVVTNISLNSLFAIPANQEFVFVNTSQTKSQDILTYMTEELIKSCTVAPGSIDPNSLWDAQVGLNDGSLDSEEHTFKKFLQQHINLAFSKGFDDNVGRHAAPVHFDIPTLATFFDVSNKVYEFFIQGTGKELPGLHGLLDTDVKFSKSRCTKVLPRALQAYQENLPSHYTRAYHESKLAHAMAVFEMHARGPLFDEFSEKLQDECEKHWYAGRQMCQVLSFTGNPCTNPLHKGGGDGAGGGEQIESRENTSDLPSMEHCSGVRYICACNCGRCQGSREDPFNVKQANYDYFQMLSIQCGCNQLETFVFPVFQPSTHNFRAAQLMSNSTRKSSIVRPETSTSQGQTQINILEVNDEITAYGSGGQSPPAQVEVIEENTQRYSDKISLTPNDENKVVIAVTDDDAEHSKEKALNRQPSTTEYLPGMLHTESPVGLLPQFSSWSLVCLGSSSIYSHNLGLQHQSGILANSAFLLPWDVTVRLEHQKEKGSLWPTISDNNQMNFSARGKNYQNLNLIRGRKSKKGKELLVKIFVGVEYECPRGHRFMAATPDKILKVTGVGTVKDNGTKVTSSTTDMPLYFPCPCRQPKPLIAQLMRIHVVTPKAPVHVTLNPRVQPGPPPCPIFVTGCEEPIRLSQSAYWILRLPYPFP
ncbi:hypothetical protein QAD02_023783 [Eretmocerus hayati]|uniref:Uncharacterized protein n=1 Tax=Eretmocerus hayati TaxID=131215 RepID=A0ACC2PYE9_9HYME|nr:hypothetical protein QAD02_023783 [Eretmocerus hayati]